MNKKIIWLIVIFLFLLPFRLPISVMFISIISYIAEIGNVELSDKILSLNVLVTKIFYNLILSVLFIYKIEFLSRYILDRAPWDNIYKKELPKTIFWWTGISAAILFAYNIFDAVNTYTLYFEIN